MAPAPGPSRPGEDDGLSRFLGLRWSDDPSSVSLDVRPELLNDAGLLLGPVSFALMDYSMTRCLWEQLGDDELLATVDISITYVCGARRGLIACTSELQRRNRRNGVLAARIHDERGGLLSLGLGTYDIFPASSRCEPPSNAQSPRPRR
jgi:uncharacterized protein (TIGR00369 family)